MGRQRLRCLVGVLVVLWPSLVAAQPNRQRDIEAIYAQLGSPALETEPEAREFTETVAAIFEFGYAPWGFTPDAFTWGVRQSGGGTIKDVLQTASGDATDIMAGSGKPGWRFQWLSVGAGTFVPADRTGLPGATPPPPPPPPPPPTDVLTHDLADYGWRLTHDQAIQAAIVDWADQALDRDVLVADVGHLNFRLTTEYAEWRARLGEPFTLGALLEETWPRGPPPAPPPPGRLVGDFLFNRYFGGALMSEPAMAARVGLLDRQAGLGANAMMVYSKWTHRQRFADNGWSGSRGFDWEADATSRQELLDTIDAATARGLAFALNTWDDDFDEDAIVAAFGRLVAHTAGRVIRFLPALEIEEPGKADTLSAQIRLAQRLRAAAAADTEIIFHYNVAPQGESQHWPELRAAGVDEVWLQWPRTASDQELRTLTRDWLADMRGSGLRIVASEWSAEANNSQHSPEERDRRARVIKAEFDAAGLVFHTMNTTTVLP